MGYKVQKPCRVCGSLYTPCSDCENDKSAFHWRKVACSIECASKYFELIEKSRKGNTEDVKPTTKEKETIEVTEENVEVGVKIAPVDTTTLDNKNFIRSKRKKNIKESEQID